MIGILKIVLQVLVAVLAAVLIWWVLGLVPFIPETVRSILGAILLVVCLIWVLTPLLKGGGDA